MLREEQQRKLVDFLQIHDDIYDILNLWMLQTLRKNFPRHGVGRSEFNEQVSILKRELEKYFSTKMNPSDDVT